MKKRTRTSRTLAITWPGLLPFLCLLVQAQPSLSNPLGYYEETIVVANKIEENLVDVPKSITVIDSDLIAESGMKNLADLLDPVPTFEILPLTPVNTPVNIRGLNTSLFTNNNPIVIYVDGIPYSSVYGFDLSLANVEQVEVLRGPQGTLYARDSIGGVVNVISKKPTDEWAGRLEAEYGNFNYRSLTFNTGGALKDDELYLSVSGQYRADDGWIANDFPGNESDANKFEDTRLNASFMYRPTDIFEAKLVVSNDDTDSFGIGGYGLLFPPTSASERLSLSDEFDRDDAENITADRESRFELKINSQALQLNYELGNVTISSVTTRRDQALRSTYDFDEGNNPALLGAVNFESNDSEAWTQELTLKSNNDDGLRYVIGLYFDDQELEQGPFGSSSPAFGTFNAESLSDFSTSAIFGQFMYPLSENLELTLGGRYQRIDRDIDLDLVLENVPLPPTFTTLFSGIGYTLDAERDWSVFLPRAALKYDITDNLNIYGSFSEGYMPGGFNLFADRGAPDDNTFEPQRSTNYEIGVKSQTAKLSFAAAVYYMEIEDIHVFNADGAIFITDNADEASSYGIELDITYQLTDELRLSAAIGLIESEYDEYLANGFDYSGQRVERTPDYTFNFAAAYYHPKGFYTRVDVSGAGKTAFFDNSRPAPDTAFPERDAYVVLDLRFGYILDDWEFYAYSNNLTDEDYITSLRPSNVGAPFAFATFNDPRTFGIGARYEF